MRLALNAHGRYEIRWTAKVRERHVVKRLSTGTSNHEHAQAMLERLKRGEPLGAPSLTMAQLLEKYVEEHLVPRAQEGKVAAPMRDTVFRHFGDKRVESITSADISIYYDKRMAGAYGHTPISVGTAWGEGVILQAAMNFGVRERLIPVTTPFRLQKPQKPEPRDLWLTEGQEAKLLDAIKGASLSVQLFVRLALAYGARKSAILELEWGQIDFDRGEIDFARPGRAQTRKRRAKVPMTSGIRALLLQRRSQVLHGRVIDRSAPRRLASITKKIGLEWVTPHVLKHTAITLMLRDGHRLETVAALTQTSIGTIMRVYRHHGADELLKAAERI
jgi:integrase